MEAILKKLIKEAVAEALAELPQQQTGFIPAVLDAKQTAEYIGYKVSWVHQNKDKLPLRLSDKPIRYLRADLDNWLEAQKQQIKKPVKLGKINVTPMRKAE